MALSGSGPVTKIGNGQLMFAKKGDAYSAAFDYTKNGGPSWTGAAWLRDKNPQSDEQVFFAAFGTPKTIALCVYKIDGGKLTGTWYPWYIDGDAKNTGTESLAGPETLDGEYKITAAKQATTGKEYSGTVTIKPLNITGSADISKAYSVTWNIGGVKIEGIAIKNKDYLVVSTGFGVATGCECRHLHDPQRQLHRRFLQARRNRDGRHGGDRACDPASIIATVTVRSVCVRRLSIQTGRDLP